MAKNKLNVVAIIIARGGSKRIPRKNIKLFLGKPIIAYPIEAALQSKVFDEIMVSTEDEEIAQISKRLGAKIPFMRSREAAKDNVYTDVVVLEVLKKYQELGIKIETFCLIYPTAVFLNGEKLKQTYRKFVISKVDALVPVVRYGYPIQRSVNVVNGKIKMIWPKNYYKLSQNLTPTYHDCGQFYWLRTKPFKKQKKLFLNETLAWELPESEVQDIDSIEDWKVAEMKYKYIHDNDK